MAKVTISAATFEMLQMCDEMRLDEDCYRVLSNGKVQIDMAPEVVEACDAINPDVDQAIRSVLGCPRLH